MMAVAVDCPDTLNAVVGSATVQFSKSRLLATGTDSAIYELRDASDTSVAVKVVPKASLQQLPHLQRLQTELDVHQMLKHEHIANFLGSCQDEKNVYMLLEPCTGITVYDIVKHHGILSEQQAAQAVLQVVHALRHMHQQGIAHRSLKLQQLQLDRSGSIKLSSFGTAAVHSNSNGLAQDQQQPALREGILADAWSLGMMLYTMLKGLEAASNAATALSYGPLVFTERSRLSLAAKDIIQALLSPTPAERPSLADVQQHPFVGQASPKERWLEGIDLQQVASQKSVPPDVESEATSPNPDDPAAVRMFWPVGTGGTRTSGEESVGSGYNTMTGFFADGQSDDDEQYYTAINSFQHCVSRDLGSGSMGDQLLDLEPSVSRMRAGLGPAQPAGVLPRTLQQGRRSSSDQGRSGAAGQRQQHTIQQMMNEVQRSMHTRPASGLGALDLGQRKPSGVSSSLLSPSDVGSFDSWKGTLAQPDITSIAAAGPAGLTQSVSARGRNSSVFAAAAGRPPTFLPAAPTYLSGGTDAAPTSCSSKTVSFSAGLSPAVTPTDSPAGLSASRNGAAAVAGAAAGKVPMPPQSPRPQGQLQAAAAAAAAAEGVVAPAPSPSLLRHAYTSVVSCPSPRSGLLRQLSSNTNGSSGSSVGATPATPYSPSVSPLNYLGRQTAARSVAMQQQMPAVSTGAAAKVPSAFQAASDQQQQPLVPGSSDCLVKSRPVYRDISPKLDEAQGPFSRSDSWQFSGQYAVLPAGISQQQCKGQAAQSAGGLLANLSSTGLSSSRNIVGESSSTTLNSARSIAGESSKSHLSGRRTLPAGISPAPPLVPPSPAQQQAAEMRIMRRMTNSNLTSPPMTGWAQRTNGACTTSYNIVPSISAACNVAPVLSAPGNIVISGPSAEDSGVSSWESPVGTLDTQQESFSMLLMRGGGRMASQSQRDSRDSAMSTNNSELPLASGARSGLLGTGQGGGGMARPLSSDKMAGQSTDNILAVVTLPGQGNGLQVRPPTYGQSPGDSNSGNAVYGRISSSSSNVQQPLPPKQMLPICRSPSVALRTFTASPATTPGRLLVPLEASCSPAAGNSTTSTCLVDSHRRLSRLGGGGDGSRSHSSNSNNTCSTHCNSVAMSVLPMGPQSSTRILAPGGLPLPAFHDLVNFGATSGRTGSEAGDDGSDDEGVSPAITHMSMPNNIVIPRDQSLTALGPPSLGRTTSSASYLQGQRSGLFMAPHPPVSHYPGGVMSPKVAPSPSIKARVAHGQHHVSGSNVVSGVQHMMLAQTPRASSLSKASSPGTTGELSESGQSPLELQAAPLGRRYFSAPPAVGSTASSSDAGRYAVIDDADADLMDSVQAFAAPLALPGIAEADSESACNTPNVDWREQQQQDERDAEPHYNSPEPHHPSTATLREQSPVKKTLSLRKSASDNFASKVASAVATSAGVLAAGKAPKAHAAIADRDQSPGQGRSSPITAGCAAGWPSPVVVSFVHYKGRLGYLMSSGLVGVIFEDSTHMITRDRWACYHTDVKPSQAAAATGSPAAEARPMRPRQSLDILRDSIISDQDDTASPDTSSPHPVCPGDQSSNRAANAAAAPPPPAQPGSGPHDHGSASVVFRLPLEDTPVGDQGSKGSTGLPGIPEHLALKANCLRRFVGCLVHNHPYSSQCRPEITKLPFPAAVEAHQQGQLNAGTVHVRRFVHREGCLLLKLTDGSHQLVFTRDSSMLLVDSKCKQLASVTRKAACRNSQLGPDGEEIAEGSSSASMHGSFAVHSMLVPLDKAAPVPADERLLAKAMYASSLVKALQLPSSWQSTSIPSLQVQGSP